eukprot:scaffold107248_cov16-Prasinocladus_malaysianus.AAC.1
MLLFILTRGNVEVVCTLYVRVSSGCSGTNTVLPAVRVPGLWLILLFVNCTSYPLQYSYAYWSGVARLAAYLRFSGTGTRYVPVLTSDSRLRTNTSTSNTRDTRTSTVPYVPQDLATDPPPPAGSSQTTVWS